MKRITLALLVAVMALTGVSIVAASTAPDHVPIYAMVDNHYTITSLAAVSVAPYCVAVLPAVDLLHRDVGMVVSATVTDNMSQLNYSGEVAGARGPNWSASHRSCNESAPPIRAVRDRGGHLA